MNFNLRFYMLLILALPAPVLAIAETVGVFFDGNEAQIKFAATDIKTALGSKGFKVEMISLNSISSKYPHKKVIIALSSNNKVTNLLNSEGGGTTASGGMKDLHGLGKLTEKHPTTMRLQIPIESLPSFIVV